MREVSRLAVILLLASAAQAATLQDANKAVARRVFEEIFNQGQFEVANEIYATDFANHGAHRDVSLKEDQDAARGWKSAFPDLKMTVQMMLADADTVTVVWLAKGTNTGTGNGLPATGKAVDGRGITIWRIVGGRIREEWSEFDQLQLMQQLGLLPGDSK